MRTTVIADSTAAMQKKPVGQTLTEAGIGSLRATGTLAGFTAQSLRNFYTQDPMPSGSAMQSSPPATGQVSVPKQNSGGSGVVSTGYVSKPTDMPLWHQALGEASKQIPNAADHLDQIRARATQIYQKEGGSFLSALSKAVKGHLGDNLTGRLERGIESAGQKAIAETKKIATGGVRAALPAVEDVAKGAVHVGEVLAEDVA